MIATLAGTRIAPLGGLTCSLQERWTELFRSKDGDDVRKIQDAFECCGFRSTNDMAFPFPGDGRGAGACVKAYGRDKACFEDWRGEERLVAGLMVAVAVGVFLWMVSVGELSDLGGQVLIIYPPDRRGGYTSHPYSCHQRLVEIAIR